MDWTGEVFIDLKINCVCGQPITAHFPAMDAQITCATCSKTYKVSTYCAVTSERDAQPAQEGPSEAAQRAQGAKPTGTTS